MTGAAARPLALTLAVATLVALDAHAQAPVPPWMDDDEGALPEWARSVVPKPGERHTAGDLVLFQGPNRASGRRGVTAQGATLSLYGARRGGGCTGRWWLVGPLAWTCSDDAVLGGEDPLAPPRKLRPDGLARDYYFVARDGASAYASVQAASEGTSDRELEGGWGVGVVGEEVAVGQRWLRTSKGLWVAARDVGAARPATFHGEVVTGGALDFAWVLADRANVVGPPSAASSKPGAPPRAPASKAVETHARFEVVHVLEERDGEVRIGDTQWMLARDLARPHVAAQPPAVTGQSERWVDVELATQTVVAYEGSKPVYATLVSTGRGPQGSDAATPFGVHRIWVKIAESDMDNVERDDLEAHYSLEDVPYVQFFDHAVALHGTYWHRDFGHVKSHGCVNLAPLDAKWMFDFTGPRLPAGWKAAYPTAVDPGSVVRVR